MPELSRFSHASMSVRDLERSTRWYCDVLEFRVLEAITGPSWTENVLIHRSGIVISLQQHAGNHGEAFDPVRTGMDHLALLVPDRAALDEWRERLEALGVEHSPPVEEHYGCVLSLKDPDGIAFELFWREGHP